MQLIKDRGKHSSGHLAAKLGELAPIQLPGEGRGGPFQQVRLSEDRVIIQKGILATTNYLSLMNKPLKIYHNVCQSAKCASHAVLL